MTAPPLTFALTLKHLSPDAKQAGIEFLETSRPAVTLRELRQLLRSLQKLAPSVEYPVEPTIRIEAPAGRFLLQVKAHQIQFTSWSSSQAHPVTPPIDEMLRIFVGHAIEGELDVEEPVAVEAPRARRRQSPVLIAAIVLVILGVNAFTVFSTRKPPGNFLAPHTLSTGAAATQMLESLAGRYETGDQPGDRRLQISRDGAVEWVKYGANRSAAQVQSFTVRLAESGGAPALLTSRRTLIKLKDPITLVYFGDAYTRIK